jgi:hypothetical protein
MQSLCMFDMQQVIRAIYAVPENKILFTMRSVRRRPADDIQTCPRPSLEDQDHSMTCEDKHRDRLMPTFEDNQLLPAMACRP